MYKTFYTLESVTGSIKIDEEFQTFKQAYDYMCKTYMRELNNGYEPTLYRIMKHNVSLYNGTTNIMIQPVWSE